jgi:hypothetical protein
MDEGGATHQTRGCCVGVIADPEAGPAEIASHLERVLPELLGSRLDAADGWRVDLVHERLPAGAPGTHTTLIEHAEGRRQDEGWSAAVCVTDLPLRSEDDQPLVADLAVGRGVAIVSLPAFGAGRLRRRTAQVVTELIAEIVAPDGAGGGAGSDAHQHTRIDDRDLPGPYRLVNPDADPIDAQVVASRGRWRQLVGMVRSNRPWRLLLGLRGAVVGAFAFSAFWLVNPSIWQLGNAHSFERLGLLSVWAIAAIVTWLIVYHHLWERGGEDAVDPEQVTLFNASTVLTLMLGIGIAYLGLLLINLVVAHLAIAPDVAREQLMEDVGFTEYFKLTWMATTGASLAGSLGSGFDSEESVREAAYSQRERERRDQWREEPN